ncbi:unnamed protein product, partial [Staurois parvus]
CCLHVCYPPALISVGISSSFTITDVISPSSSSSSLTSTLILIRLSSCWIHLPNGGERWWDLPVWNPGNTEDKDISLVGSHYWIHLPDGGERWWDLPVWSLGNTEDGDISLVGSHYWIHLPDGGERW